jgi:hypothetical protein
VLCDCSALVALTIRGTLSQGLLDVLPHLNLESLAFMPSDSPQEMPYLPNVKNLILILDEYWGSTRTLKPDPRDVAKAFPGLTSLDMSGWAMNDADVAALQALTQLQTLKLRNCNRITVDAVKDLPPSLTDIEMRVRVTNDFMKAETSKERKMDM